MILRATNDIDEIKSVMFDDSVYDKIWLKKDAPKKADVKVKIGNIIYIVAEDAEIFAVACFERFRGALKIHPYILKSHKRKAREFLNKAFNMVNCKLYIEIDNSDKLLMRLAKNLNFKVVSEKDTAILVRACDG